jgi:hypothetical protein
MINLNKQLNAHDLAANHADILKDLEHIDLSFDVSSERIKGEQLAFLYTVALDSATPETSYKADVKLTFKHCMLTNSVTEIKSNLEYNVADKFILELAIASHAISDGIEQVIDADEDTLVNVAPYFYTDESEFFGQNWSIQKHVSRALNLRRSLTKKQ